MAVLYAYCNYSEAGEQSVRNILGSLLRQLLEWRREVSPTVRTLYDRIKEARIKATENDIIQALWTEIADFSTVFIVIDALDEISKTGLKLLQTLGQSLPGNLKLLVTSRPISSIEEYFEGKKRKEISAKEEDIALYVRAQIKSNNFGLRNIAKPGGDVEKLIVERIVDKVKGM
jgi:hypothetical protein